MIKINLVPQRKPKRQAEPGQRDVMIGVLALVAAMALTYLAHYRPKVQELADQQAANADFQASLDKRKRAIKALPELRAAVAAAEERSGQIAKLVQARAVPAHMLHELGEILTPGRQPTMTAEIAARVANPRDEVYRYRDDWDPKRVWLTVFGEDEGKFTLQGGAASESDVSQLSKRLQASSYFEDVVPTTGAQAIDKATGTTYYTFTIEGRVVY